MIATGTCAPFKKLRRIDLMLEEQADRQPRDKLARRTSSGESNGVDEDQPVEQAALPARLAATPLPMLNPDSDRRDPASRARTASVDRRAAHRRAAPSPTETPGRGLIAAIMEGDARRPRGKTSCRIGRRRPEPFHAFPPKPRTKVFGLLARIVGRNVNAVQRLTVGRLRPEAARLQRGSGPGAHQLRGSGR